MIRNRLSCVTPNSLRGTLRTLTLAGVLLALCATPCLAETLKVPSASYPTIQSAVDDAASGDVVSVGKGHYLEQVNVTTAGISLVGKKAIIDAEFAGPCLLVQAADLSVSGFTFINGTFGVADQEADGLDDDEEGFARPDRLLLTKCVMATCRVGVDITANEVTITSNTIQGCDVAGIILDSISDEHAVVSRNTVEGVQGPAMVMEAVSILVERNRVRFCFDGIFLELEVDFAEGGGPLPSLLSKNRVEGVVGVGMSVENQTGVVATIERNKLRKNARGLAALGADFSVLKNDCSDNTEIGLLLGDEDDEHFIQSVVRGNRACDNGAEGIRLDGPFICRYGPAFPNVVEDNECEGNGHDGIVIWHAHKDEVRDNSCKKNGGDGIDIERKTGGILLVDNVCSKNTHEGIDNNGDGTLMAGNTCKGNGRGLGPDVAGTGDDGSGSALDLGGNSFDTGGFNVAARLDLDDDV